MKSIQINAYGNNDVLEINPNTPKPVIKKNQILVEVHAASLNAIDWKIRAGFVKDMMPVTFPATLGGDFSGFVTEVGEEVKEFSIGDKVYGQAIVLNGGSGSFAEFVAANAKNSAIKPDKTTFEEASALPLVGSSAVQALEEHMKLQSGQKILIHGGAGGIGHIAIQIAKSIGAYVATTVNEDDVDFVKKLGANEVIDYKTQKFEEVLKDFDAVFDTIGGETMTNSFQVLKHGGVLVSMLGQPDKTLAEKYGVTGIGQGTQTDTKHLVRLTELVDSEKVKVHVDKIFPLEQIKEAFTYQEETHPQGKVVLQIKK